MDEDWLHEVGMVEALEPYLTKVFVREKVRVTCTAWRRLFRMQEAMFEELCMEFLATVPL